MAKGLGRTKKVEQWGRKGRRLGDGGDAKNAPMAIENPGKINP
jgi:hypothetical protein